MGNLDKLRLEADTDMPLRDVVKNTLRSAILRGDLKPGERLMEIHLAKQLGVSRTPVREAIRLLEIEGLAVTVPRRGAHVAKMTEKDLEDVLEIREALDELAVKDACLRMTDDDYKELEEAFAEFKKTCASNDVRVIAEADENFHSVIYRASKNPKLVVIVENLKEQMYRFRYEYLRGIEDFSNLIAEHEAIMKDLAERNEDAVREEMHKHLRNQIDCVRDVIRNTK